MEAAEDCGERLSTGTRPGAAAAAEEQREVAKERGLQPALVKDFLGMVQRRNRLGPEFSATMRGCSGGSQGRRVPFGTCAPPCRVYIHILENDE